MASDRARISFDPSRAYRAVIAQQGRVTLDADVNEAAEIATEALRLETIDIIGPCGTPSVPAPGDGYLVVAGSNPAETAIHDGVFYLGGWRLALENPVKISEQPDWRDQPRSETAQGGDFAVALLVTEQSVCAVEDQALREVALGGPDTAARRRLMQRFVLVGSEGDTCADGAASIAGRLDADGVSLDPASAQIISKASLQVGFVTDGAKPDPCSPAAAGGYLGADNQLVRVTVSRFDPQAGLGDLLWGWNNAAYLYRADLTDKAKGVFTLRGAPLDQEHAPQLGQAVEILRVRTDLGDDNLIAADAGFVTTIARAYSFDDGTLVIDDALPGEFLADPGPFFIRIWQAIVPFTVGQAAALDTTSGLSVTVNLPALPAGDLAARPFWRFAVRPDTPAQVYPARYLEGPQPPDGPRQWLCDLGVIGPGANGYSLVADCRPRFTPLTDLNCDCCGLTLDPAGVAARGGLQAVVDSLIGSPAILSLRPGAYVLPRPLTLTAHHRGLTIEGCSAGASIRAEPSRSRAFVGGLVHLRGTNAVTLRGLDFDLALEPAGKGATVVGILAEGCGLTTIESCAFGISVPDSVRVGHGTTTGQTQGGSILGGAIVLTGRSADMTIRRNRFVGKHVLDGAVICGVLAASTARVVQTILEDVLIDDNYFERLNAAVIAFARLGDIRCEDNRVRHCTTGFFFADTVQGVSGAFAKHALNEADRHPVLAMTVQKSMPIHWLAHLAQSDAPFLGAAQASDPAHVSPLTQDAIVRDANERGVAAFAEVSTHVLRTRETGTSTPQAAPAHEAAAPGQPEQIGRASALRLEFMADLNHVHAVSVAATLAAVVLTPVLRLTNNDLALTQGAGKLVGVGIAALFGGHDLTSTVLMNGNRVASIDPHGGAAVLWFPGSASVTGNVVTRPRDTGTAAPQPVFVVLGLNAGHYAYAGNVFHAGALITPARALPPPSPDWSFLNTVT